MSLAQELEADFASDSDPEVLEQQHNQEHQQHVEQQERKRKAASSTNVHSICTLLHSTRFQDILTNIQHYKAQPSTIGTGNGPIEENPEYRLIIQANNITVDLDNDIVLVHQFIKEKYNRKFPELESLVMNPLDYARTVQFIGNTMDMASLDLKQVLPSATAMMITLTGTTTEGTQLSTKEMEVVQEACTMALELDASRHVILDYVSSRMAYIAPNLTILLGSTIAAKLVSMAGGLTALSGMPACNVQVMGASKTSTAGYSTLHIGRHVGVLYQADLISKRPIDLRTRAARMTAAKVVLAARIDRLHESTDGYMGKQFVEQINHKLDRLIEPNSLMGKNAKALPIPDEPKRKRRGGRKYRKRREELHQSELQKLKNRVAFGTVAEEDILDGDEMEGLGMAAGTMMGASTGARLRVGVMDESKKQSRKLNVSAAMARRLKVLDQAGGGTASSLAFTPVQGLELENPETKRVKLSDANNRYFNASSGFGLGLG